MKRSLSALLFLVTLLAKTSIAYGADQRRAVLVTDAATGINELSDSECRRLYLGFPVIARGRVLEAAINQSDPLLYEIFLQKIVHMTASVYERHVLTNFIQLGGKRPTIFHDRTSLLNLLKHAPGTVSMLWEHEAKTQPNLIILGAIWQGKAD